MLGAHLEELYAMAGLPARSAIGQRIIGRCRPESGVGLTARKRPPFVFGESLQVCKRRLGPEILGAEREMPQGGQPINDRASPMKGIQQLPQIEPEDVMHVAEQIDLTFFVGRDLYDICPDLFDLLVERVKNLDVFFFSFYRSKARMCDGAEKGAC